MFATLVPREPLLLMMLAKTQLDAVWQQVNRRGRVIKLLDTSDHEGKGEAGSQAVARPGRGFVALGDIPEVT